MTYSPYKKTQRALDRFEEEIGMPLSRWLREAAASGASIRVMAEKSGVTFSVIRKLLSRHSITTTGEPRVVRRDGSLNLASVMRRHGITDSATAFRVRRLVKSGMPIPQAIAEATAPRAVRLKKIADNRH